jgi:urease accessory protein UreG
LPREPIAELAIQEQWKQEDGVPSGSRSCDHRDHGPGNGDHNHDRDHGPGNGDHNHGYDRTESLCTVDNLLFDRETMGWRRPLRVGVGGPVGSGKTALVASLCQQLSSELDLAVVTNDIYTTEDADFLKRAGVLEQDRIVAVETGCCPHTAIRDDIAANLEAIELLEKRFPNLDLVLVESGGDNLTATFSYGLVHVQIFVLDVAGGDKVPRKGGPGVTISDLLVINKVDLAELVGADLSVMMADARSKRGDRPVVMCSLRSPDGGEKVATWIRELLEHAAA